MLLNKNIFKLPHDAMPKKSPLTTVKYLPCGLLVWFFISLMVYSGSPCYAQNQYPVTWDSTEFTLHHNHQPVKNRENWQQWLAQPFFLSADSSTVSFEVKNSAGKKATVGNCKQLFAADSKDMENFGPDRVVYRAWAKSCYAGRAMQQSPLYMILSLIQHMSINCRQAYPL